MIVKVYRGQHGLNDAKIQTRLPSISFGSLNAAEIYANFPNNKNDIIVKPVIMEAIIKIENPIIFNRDDCFADFDLLSEKLGKDFMWHMAEKYESAIYNTNNWEDNFSSYNSIKELKNKDEDAINDIYMDAYPLLDDVDFVNFSKKLGFDGAVHIGNGKTYNKLEYRIFSENQILQIKDMSFDIY